ncbi:hypothetical protein ACHAQJ_002170 [Trichoderma viride]
MGSPIVNLGLECPESSLFYICEDQPTRFVGCCTIDPCSENDGICPDGDVQPASFSPDAYDQILAQECLDPGFLWYTCRDSSPPFLGCCSQMACEANGCPVDKVGGASLSSNPKQAAPFLFSGSTTRSTSSTTTWTTSTTINGPVSTTASTSVSTNQSAAPQQSTQPPPSAHTGLSKGAIGGIAAAAAAAGVCILAFVVFWALRNARLRKKQSVTAVGGSGKDYQDGTAAASDTLLGGGGNGAAAGHMAQLSTSPPLQSPAISELPATPSQQSINSGATPAATRHIVSMSSSSGAGGRESAISGFSASVQQTPHMKQQPSPLVHQSLFELEDSSSRTLMERWQ